MKLLGDTVQINYYQHINNYLVIRVLQKLFVN